MKSNIYIPKTIKIGYQKRRDTYTNMLAYVIYYDEKNKLRKETSWENWRDKYIEPQEFENEPTEGFVLNKKVGDYVSYWGNHHRQAYVRVYDSVRNFEFEITIENLLYILENTSSIKGKGLEGKFVFAWSGTELVLLPVNSADYKEIQKYTEMLNENFKLKSKDLKVGATYLTKCNHEYTYLGKFDVYDYNWSYNPIYHNYTYTPTESKGKYHFFYTKTTYSEIHYMKDLNKFVALVSEEKPENFHEMIDKLERDKNYSPIDKSKNEFISYTFEELLEYLSNFEINEYSTQMYDYNKNKMIIKKRGNNAYIVEIKMKHSNVFIVEKCQYQKAVEMTLEEIFEKYKPCYLNIYLQNGKLYEREG